MTRIKICGLTREADVDAAIEEGADFLGFNLWRGSKRAVTPSAARALVERVRAPAIAVGVFVSGEAEPIARADDAGVTWLQIHGAIGSERPRRPLIRAVAVDRALTPRDLAGAEWFILDAPQAGHGGGGKTFDWSLADGLKDHAQLFVAGGLTPENVAEVVRRLRPFAVDVASGVESAPGKKDRKKIRDFIQAVREASR